MNRERTLIVILVLAQQLRVWLLHALSLGTVTREMKYLSGILNNSLNNFIKLFFSGHANEEDAMYESSVLVSEVIEGLVTLSRADVQRVQGLVNKLRKEQTSKIKEHEPAN